MVLKAFKKIAQDAYNTDKLQSNSEQNFNQIGKVPFMTGNRLTSVAIVTTTTKVEHKLGRNPLGYIITKQDANSVIWQVSQDDLFITFDCSSNVTIDLWVF